MVPGMKILAKNHFSGANRYTVESLLSMVPLLPINGLYSLDLMPKLLTNKESINKFHGNLHLFDANTARLKD